MPTKPLTESRIKQLLHEYRENGISAIPVHKKRKGANGFTGKGTIITGWSQFSDILPTEKQIDSWNYSNASGVAVVLGPASNLACVDIDRNDPFALQKMQPSEYAVVGKKGEKRFFRQRYSDSEPLPSGGIITHNEIEFFLRGKYAVVDGLHSQGDNTDPLFYKTRGYPLIDADFDAIPVFESKYIDIARGLNTQDDPIAPKVEKTLDGNLDGRFLDMESEVAKVIARNFSRDDAIQHLVDHGRARNPHNLFFKDRDRFPRCGDEETNAEWFIASHRLTFAAKKKHPQEIERPKTNTYSRIYQGKEWPAPIPFTIEDHVKDLDPSIIPKGPWREWIEASSRNVQCDIGPLFMQALTVLSSLIGTKTTIFPKKKDLGFTVFPILWTLHIARSGSKKSPITKRVSGILKEFQAEENETFKEKQAEVRPILNRINKKLKYANRKLDDFIQQSMENDNLEHEIESWESRIVDIERELEEHKVYKRQFVIDLITPEKLYQVLENNPQGVLFKKDEFSSLWNTFKKTGYEGFRQFLLQCHDGEGASYQTKNQGENFLKEAGIALLGNLQPSLLEGMLEETIKNHDDGFLQRALLSAETSIEREIIDEEIDEKITEQVNQVFECARSLQPSAVTFTDPAQVYYMEYLKEIEVRRKGHEDFVGSFIGKFSGKIAILAYLIEFLKPKREQMSKISLASLKTAREILEYNYRNLILQKNRPVYTMAYDIIDLFKLRFIHTDEPLSKLERVHCRFFRTKYTKKLLKLLENYNYIRLEKVGKANILRINPSLLGDKPDTNRIKEITNGI